MVMNFLTARFSMSNSEWEELVDINRKLVNLLDKLLDDGSWDASPLLRISAKQIQKVRDEAKSLLDSTKLITETEEMIDSNALPEGHAFVYVYMFLSDGDKLERWRQLILSLPGHTLSRPTYLNERDVINRIKARGSRKQEGYVKIVVKDENIIKGYAGRGEHDPYGNELITVKEGSITKEHILEFVHANSFKYKFRNDQLIQDDD